MRRVAIIASASGNGKTTLGRALAARLGVRFVELDALVHGPNWTETPDDELKATLQPILAEDGWVIDGNYTARSARWCSTPPTRSCGSTCRPASGSRAWCGAPGAAITGKEALWNGNKETWRDAVWGRESLFGYALTQQPRRRREYPQRLAGRRSSACAARARSTAGWRMSEMRPGTEFADHVIRGIAGRGGMGIVYRATHVPLEREVALKVIAPEFSQDGEFRSRFQREFRAAASIQHPNVIPVYHAGEQDGLLYVTMRYVDGTDLARLLQAEGRLDPRTAAHVIAQVAEALDAAHRAGHRAPRRQARQRPDRDDRRRPARHADRLRPDEEPARDDADHAGGSVIGTFDYAAPEQLKEGPIDARTDVYALGGVLYQALTGKVPYPRETAAATMLAHLDAPPPSVLTVLPDASELLGEVVRRAMAKDPRDRYPSAGDLGRSALGAAQDRRTSTEERSVAAGAAAPDSVLHTEPPLPLPPALAVETGGGRFVGREAQLDDAGRRLRRGRARQAPVRPALAASPGSARRGWRPRSPAAPTTRARPCSTAATTRESLVPYQPFIAALEHWVSHRERLDLPAELALELTEVARFVPGLRKHVPELKETLAEEPEMRRYRLFEGVTRLLAFAARERPVVLLLDDLHWADASTTLLLGHMLQDAAPMRLFVLGTARTFEGELLARLRRQRALEKLELTRPDRGGDARAGRPRRRHAASSSSGSPRRPRATRSSSRRRCAACRSSRSARSAGSRCPRASRS